MTILDAERRFREGLVALVEARHVDAAVYFEEAMRAERSRGVTRQQMRYLSYYGLSTALNAGPTTEAVRACEVAARRDSFNPDLLLNLGKVYMLAGQRSKALSVFERGLKIDPNHKGLCSAVHRTNRRRPNVLPWLSRGHPVNYWLGRMRHSRFRGPVGVTARW